MKEIIKQLLNKAYEEHDLELAEIASDLMSELASTFNCPSDWQSILEELYKEYKGNDWIMCSVYEFAVMYDNGKFEEV